jgi:glycosyltransferase involved in cell wall biosynthesis
VGRRRDDRVVSVVVTAFDADRYLDGCLASIVASSHRELDVVVVDDGSTDGTAEIIDRWARSEQRIRSVSTPHVGRREALTLAHGLAHGDLHCWVDADDEVHPSGIASCLAWVDAEHELVYSYRELIDATGVSLGPHVKNRVTYRPIQLLVDNMIFHLRLFTAELFERSGGVGKLESSIDWDMNLRMAELTSVVCVPRVLYRYRVHDDRMSMNEAQSKCGQVAVRRAIERRGLDAELIVRNRGWELRQRSS